MPGSCRPKDPSPLQAQARSFYQFDLANVPGEGGSVLDFENSARLAETYDAYDELRFLAGPHVYQSKAALILVQFNEGAPENDGIRARKILAQLSRADGGANGTAPDTQSTGPTPTPAPLPSGVSAKSVCARLENEGIAVAGCCAIWKKSALQLSAREFYGFDLAKVSGEGGSILDFSRVDAFQKAVDGYEEFRALAGPHIYSSKSALILIQFNENAPASDGQQVQTILNSL